MTLLTIISDPELGAAILCGLPAPTSIVGSSDPNATILLALANQEGRELARRHDWQGITVDYTVPTLAAELQTDLPSDYDRLLPYPELWNRTASQMFTGPTSARTWGQIKGTGMTTGSPGWWRLNGGSLYITPAPSAGDTLAFFYVSKNWVEADAGGTKTNFTIDSDFTLIPEHLITLGIVWRYKQSKGFKYDEDMATYEREVERAASRDRGLGAITPQVNNRSPIDRTWSGTVVP
jgi:hypothetical protein